MIVEGSIAVKAAISNKKRNVELVYIDSAKKTKDFNYIRKLVKTNNIPLKEINSQEFSTITTGKTHGGVVCLCGKRKQDELTDSDIFYLDGIEDPYNLGYIMRTLYAFGVKNVLLGNRDYTNMEAQLLKSSAGAYDMLNVSVISEPLEMIDNLKEKNYTVYALKRGDEATDIFKEEFNNKSLFLLGGEKRGISSTLLEKCDKYLYIPYGSDFRNSLNAAAAADVVATLLFSKRK